MSQESDAIIVQRIRDGETSAWADLISRYEGRLLSFAESRLNRRQASEDVVQETFIGFLNSLPNFDGERPLESYLFTICAHKLTDHMRREGRRPTLPLASASTGASEWDIPGKSRAASSIVRSGERRRLEEEALAHALRDQFEHWVSRGDFTKIKCVELIYVRGRSNKEVAQLLELSEQQVANYKFDFLARIRKDVKKLQLSRDIFPELYEESTK